MASATVYIFPMRKNEREWQVIRLRAKGEYLGMVEAPDQETALKVALKQIRLDSVEAKRLLIRPA